MDTLLIFFLNRSFFLIVQKNQKPGFLNQRVPPDSVYNLKWREKFQINRLYIRDSDWQKFRHFSGYKYKIKLVSRLREDQTLISISTILKFSAQISYCFGVLNSSFVGTKDVLFFLGGGYGAHPPWVGKIYSFHAPNGCRAPPPGRKNKPSLTNS